MDEMKHLKVFTFLILVSGSLISCSGLFDTKFMGMDFYTDKDGNMLIADTPAMWEDFVTRTKRHIEKEINNQRAPGVNTWNESWVISLESIKKDRQNPDKYIDYIITQRRKAGLAELH